MFDHFSLPTLVIGYVALIFSLSVHEASHAASAYWLGDDTAARMGRMTLNPLAHIDPIGTVLFPLIGMTTGIRLIGWAKPVPVRPVQFTRKVTMRTGYALVSAAGPASNLVLAVIFTLVTAVAARSMSAIPDARLDIFYSALDGYPSLGEIGISGTTQILMSFSGTLVIMNIALAIFNMLPIGPLDGAGVLSGVLPRKMSDSFDRIRPKMYIVLVILVFTGLARYILGPIFMAVFFVLRPVANLLLGA